MLEVERHVKYADIAICISDGELEQALLAVKKRMDAAVESHDLEEMCRLNIFFAWIYYLYTYYPLCIQYSGKVLKHLDIIDDNLVSQAYIIRGLAHFQQGKLARVYDAMQQCLRLNPKNEDALKMIEVLRMKGFKNI